jgi:hypothetical protein
MRNNSNDYLGNSPDHRREYDARVAIAMLTLAVIVILCGVAIAIMTGGVVE